VRLSILPLLLFAAASLSPAQSGQPTYYSVPPSDAPELAARGSYSVGVRTIQLSALRNQPDILRFDKNSGKAPLYDRPLTVEVWYPAVIPSGQQEQTTYRMPAPGSKSSADPAIFEIPDKALRDAPPVKDASFPLVIVSHGYPGSRYFLSYLTANLASKGFVVAAIDHTDSVFGDVKGFESTLLNRSSDQLMTIESLEKLSQKHDHFLHGLADTSKVAIVGYSMGGYGAIISGGAGISGSSGLLKAVPGGYLRDWTAGDPKFQALDRSRIKAIVAIAPWGEQPPYQAWDADGLAAIRIPSLFIAGDHDDVADYANGIKKAFELAVHSERCLLVYENARHNTGGNPAPVGAPLDYGLLQSFDEPVWRKDRIDSINQHFITAFLDLYLKGDRSKAEFLHVAPVRSDDGQWPAQSMARDKGEYSAGKGGSGNEFWKGFQRRWSLGLEMSCSAARD
jgi:predicted dienelactone hydrolase